jgi:hypothetical protein
MEEGIKNQRFDHPDFYRANTALQIVCGSLRKCMGKARD